MGRPSGGIGFFVDAAAASRFTYLGNRQPGAASTPHGAVWASIAGHNASATVYIASVYMPDTSKGPEAYAAALARLRADIAYYKRKPGHVVIMGDFNAHVAACLAPERQQRAPLYGGSNTNPAGQALLTMCDDLDLSFLTGRTEASSAPTFANGTNTSHVDHILADSAALAWADTAHTMPLSHPAVTACKSDHTALHIDITGCIRRPRAKGQPFQVWNLSKFDTPPGTEHNSQQTPQSTYSTALAIAAHSAERNLDSMLDCPDTTTPAAVSTVTTLLVDAFCSAGTDTIGKSTIRPGHTRPWMTAGAKKAIQTRKLADAHWRNTNRARFSSAQKKAAEDALRDATAEVTRTVKRARRAYDERSGAHKAAIWTQDKGHASSWRAIRPDGHRTAQTQHITALRDASGTLHADTPGKLAALSEHHAALAQAGPPPADSPAPVLAHHERIEAEVAAMAAQRYADNPAIDAPISDKEVEDAIDHLKTRKAQGHDGLPTEFLKHGGKTAIRLVTKLFRVIWQTESIPAAWRQGLITNLYKAGDNTDVANYRPITLLPVMDKLFTAILATRLEKFLPLSTQQYGFRQGRGVQDPLATLLTIVEHRKRAGLRTHAFFLDLKKAYDVVWHAGLFYKLHHKGVKGKLWRIIRALYADCKSAPRLDGQIGSFFHLGKGVAQGCPMSPILFNVMIDDLLEMLQNDFQEHGIALAPGSESIVAQAYADDAHSLSGSRAGLQTIIDAYAAHLRLWQSPVNTGKSHTLVFNPKGAASDAVGNRIAEDGPDSWTFDGHPLIHRDSTKLLGLHLRSDSSWKDQTASALRKGVAAFHIWKHTLQNRRIPMKAKLCVIRSCIKPCITYGMELWAPRNEQAYSQLDKPVKWAMRTAMGIRHSRRHHYLVDLLHYDLAIRPMRSENIAAHVRFRHRMQHAERGSHKAAALALSHATVDSWARRARGWCADVRRANADDSIADTLADSNFHEDTPERASNAEINKAVAHLDTNTARNAARRAGRMACLAAMNKKPCLRPHPYIHHERALDVLSVRGGSLPHDTPYNPQADPGPPRKRQKRCAHAVRTGKRKHQHSDDTADAPPGTYCQDCTHDVDDPEPVTPEHLSICQRERDYRLLLHRITTCSGMHANLPWYHDVALRIAPTPDLARAISYALQAGPFFEAARYHEWKLAAQPLLDHIQSPTDVCDKTDFTQQASMIAATSHLLTISDPADLPAPDMFGPPPTVETPQGPLTSLTPDGLSLAFLIRLKSAFPFTLASAASAAGVSPSAPAEGHEAEAHSPVRPRAVRRTTRSRTEGYGPMLD